MKSVILINYCNVEYKAVYCGGKYITPCMYRKEEIYVCIVSVWNAMIEVTVDLLEKPCALPLYSCKQSFFFIFFSLILISLQIMEAMALHLESSYEKLYRWSQGEPAIPLLEQN